MSAGKTPLWLLEDKSYGTASLCCPPGRHQLLRIFPPGTTCPKKENISSRKTCLSRGTIAWESLQIPGERRCHGAVLIENIPWIKDLTNSHLDVYRIRPGNAGDASATSSAPHTDWAMGNLSWAEGERCIRAARGPLSAPHHSRERQ